MADIRLRKALDAWEETLFPKEGGRDMLLSVLDAYDTPGRYYHTLLHLTEMTEILCEYRAALPDFTATICACLWHDIVYDARRSDNEEASIQRWYKDADTLELPQAQVDRGATFIAATKKHQPTDDSFDMALFLDADLAVLGAARARYRSYLHAIRREYAHVPENAYREGRIGVLKKFLRRAQIYFTPALRERFESAARENLAYEIALLQKPDRFTGEFTRTAHGRNFWQLDAASVAVRAAILPILEAEFGLSAVTPPIEGPGQTVGTIRNGTHTLAWGNDDYCSFYLYGESAGDDAFVTRVGERLGNLLHEPRFNLYRVYV
jgi:predicted metal-dependent HD superfamily phosphohydrolase